MYAGPDQIICQQVKEGLMRPAYVLVRDEELHAVVLCIRGTQSMKDLFTSLTGLLVRACVCVCAGMCVCVCVHVCLCVC